MLAVLPHWHVWPSSTTLATSGAIRAMLTRRVGTLPAAQPLPRALWKMQALGPHLDLLPGTPHSLTRFPSDSCARNLSLWFSGFFTCTEPSHRRSDNYADPVNRNRVLLCVTAYGYRVQLTNATNTRTATQDLTSRQLFIRILRSL